MECEVSQWLGISRCPDPFKLAGCGRITASLLERAQIPTSGVVPWLVGNSPIVLKGMSSKQCGKELRISEIVVSVMSDTRTQQKPY